MKSFIFGLLAFFTTLFTSVNLTTDVSKVSEGKKEVKKDITVVDSTLTDSQIIDEIADPQQTKTLEIPEEQKPIITKIIDLIISLVAGIISALLAKWLHLKNENKKKKKEQNL